MHILRPQRNKNQKQQHSVDVICIDLCMLNYPCVNNNVSQTEREKCCVCFLSTTWKITTTEQKQTRPKDILEIIRDWKASIGDGNL